ncbi:uncharacterized protein LOC120357658 isoform X1 [Solenopsis invicta]|uniref:uncharacterized protein LOC120357065 isoform X1 n=1 Tax=Solenopsis invicta TaxID=13686 RepID=UPI00193CC2FA|nr:uncharacterized protein LOC120357065 isoform X1 [Solenopsis invicta]XP_039304644.1 uncharacterized protein LOC120357658 isoform X1 [Solenopsis invicta]
MERLFHVIRVTYPADARLMVHNEEQLVVPIRHLLELRITSPRPVSFIIYINFKLLFYVYNCNIKCFFLFLFQNISRDQIEIAGFINISDAKYRRWYRQWDQWYNEREWVCNEWDLEDQWDLQILFGERVYQEEIW